ncbi:hypothetical protein [Roseateles sp. BYS87W]|uniref:Uncharacterized protein n=1 Tax=Pelomonas baiyunensis TaxID=3299026 RepID=A0ABW7GUP7_9BURK
MASFSRPTPHTATPDRALPGHHGPTARRVGGSQTGRLMQRSRTRTAGIRFEWVMRTVGPVLRVVATWKDRHGHPHHTSYSVQSNGLEGALDLAIASRISCGAPRPDREDLLQRLQQEFATAPRVALQLRHRAPGRTAPVALLAQGSLASMEASVASSQANG